jgi:hypothetical protein
MFSEQKDMTGWTEAIEHNRDALIRIVAALFAMLGLVSGGSLPRMPQAMHRAVLRVLTPAEAALRRLIVIAAQGLVVTLKPARLRPQSSKHSSQKGRASPPPFRLSDPPKRTARPRRPRLPIRAEPRVRILDYDPRICALPEWRARPRPKPVPDGLIDPKRLCRRLEALKRALADIPQQAKRLARWRARQEARQPPTSTPQPASPLRDGLPPGHRKKPQHEVDEVLAECHDLALYVLAPDTS